MFFQKNKVLIENNVLNPSCHLNYIEAASDFGTALHSFTALCSLPAINSKVVRHRNDRC